MKRIYFIRHAEAQSSGRSDFERELSPKGKADAMRLGELLRSRHVAPQLIVASSAVRALTTARIIAATLGVPQALRASRELYDINLWDLAEFVRELDGALPRFFGADKYGPQASSHALRGSVKSAGSVLHARGVDAYVLGVCESDSADDAADAQAANDGDSAGNLNAARPPMLSAQNLRNDGDSADDLNCNARRKLKEGVAIMGVSGISGDAEILSASGDDSVSVCGSGDVVGDLVSGVGYGVGNITIASRLGGSNDAQCVFIVGHNPAIGGICELLGERGIGKFPPCAICGLEFEAKNFIDIAEHSGRIVMFDCP